MAILPAVRAWFIVFPQPFSRIVLQHLDNVREFVLILIGKCTQSCSPGGKKLCMNLKRSPRDLFKEMKSPSFWDSKTPFWRRIEKAWKALNPHPFPQFSADLFSRSAFCPLTECFPNAGEGDGGTTFRDRLLFLRKKYSSPWICFSRMVSLNRRRREIQ